uniref:Uncharacterized protein n=1 Tax=viral metagenome TaxID=1070528 RepID=A0A6H2A708_9ZZZZ
MGVFEEGGGYPDSAKGSVERCKRDYEAEIAKAKERQAVTLGLRNAISGYLKVYGRRDSKTFTLPALYGALVLDEEEQIIIIEALQEAWENDK